MQLTAQFMQRLVGISEPMLHGAIGNLARTEHPYVLQDLPKDLFDEIIDTSLQTARGYGLSTPEDLATFVMLQFEVGPEFHRHPVVKAVLEDVGIPPDRKVEAMLERVPDAVWSEIESLLHKQTWFPALREPDEV